MPPIRLLSWGANSHSQLGHGFQSEQLIVPKEVDLSEISLEAENIKKIVGGAGHSLILDKYGCVYACGWNSKGQTGIPGEDIMPKFKKIESLKDEVITDIDCGWDSTMCLNENGEIFVWGSNSFGQLGIDPQRQNCILQPQKIIMNEKIERFSLGLRHTALVTETGKILTSGTGGKCQLGLIDSENKPIRRANIFTEGDYLLSE
ncbi:secretion-regulating guanine nucleotide exchange factor [Cephus cinctus]|uniref:Secretion-regulating guanine nucleotide exchange factor n=1 Tax=Cephus cinctus TaxID=211228 RepID=A0AAJ7R826_CEPCN|nr:secretion-regulating guanine nucleotide exchange factor [Cephus cinctus]